MLKTAAELDPPEEVGKSSTLGTSQDCVWSQCTKGEIIGVPTGTGYFTAGQSLLLSTLILKRRITKILAHSIVLKLLPQVLKEEKQDSEIHCKAIQDTPLPSGALTQLGSLKFLE